MAFPYCNHPSSHLCSGSPAIDGAGDDQNRLNNETKEPMALLAAKEGLTNSIDMIYFIAP